MFTFQINDHLSLKLLEVRDAKELFYLVDNSRPYLKEWLTWVNDIRSEEDYKPVIKGWLNQFVKQDGFQAGILFKGNLVGVAGLNEIDWSNKKTSIGYWLSQQHQGKGLMTQVVKALVEVAFNDFKLNRVEIQCVAENLKSRNIPERLGFKQEGTLRQSDYLSDAFHDCVIYSLLSNEWLEKKM